MFQVFFIISKKIGNPLSPILLNLFFGGNFIFERILLNISLIQKNENRRIFNKIYNKTNQEKNLKKKILSYQVNFAKRGK